MKPVALLALALALPCQAFALASTPDAALSTLWRAMSNEPGGSADVEALREIFREDAVVFGGRHDQRYPARRWTGAGFIKAFEGPRETGFHECEIHRTVHVHGRFAVAYSVVESRADRAAREPDFVGVNGIHLYRDGTQWKVMSLAYYVEDPALAIVPAGTSGQCLNP